MFSSGLNRSGEFGGGRVQRQSASVMESCQEPLLPAWPTAAEVSLGAGYKASLLQSRSSCAVQVRQGGWEVVTLHFLERLAPT